MTEGKRNIIQGLLQEYNIESAADIQEALKDLLGGTIKEMMEAEMDDHLGYEKSERSDSDDARNGYKSKRITTSYGGMEIEVPQDRKSTFEPKVVKKRQKDILGVAHGNGHGVVDHEHGYRAHQHTVARHGDYGSRRCRNRIDLHRDPALVVTGHCEIFSVNIGLP